MSRMSDDAGRVRMALAHVQQGVKGERNDLAMRGLAVLVQLGDLAALRQVEDCLSTETLYHYYGDRDDEPLPWEIDPAIFAALTRWWERLGLGEERAGWLVDDWLGETRHFGQNSWRLWKGTAPALADKVGPRLLAALSGADIARRQRIADGLGYLPTPLAGQALVALLDDPDAAVGRREAVWALRRMAKQPDIAAVVLGALRSASPRIRLGALEALDWFHGLQHRHDLTFPVLFERAMLQVARLLTDPEPAIRRLAITRVNRAGYHLDLLRPSRARAWDRALDLPDDLDLVPLLADDDEGVLAGLSLAGRRDAAAEAASRPAALARIVAVLSTPSSPWLTIGAALQAAARLRAVEAIPVITAYLDDRTRGHADDAVLVLGQLGYAPARPAIVRLCHTLPYEIVAPEVLAILDAATGTGDTPSH